MPQLWFRCTGKYGRVFFHLLNFKADIENFDNFKLIPHSLSQFTESNLTPAFSKSDIFS